MSFTLTNLEYVLVPCTIVLVGGFFFHHHTTKTIKTNYFLNEKKVKPKSSSIIETEKPNGLETDARIHNPTLDVIDRLTQEPIVFDYEEVSHRKTTSDQINSVTFSYSLKPDQTNWKEGLRNSFVKNNKKYEVIQWIPKDANEEDKDKECRYSWSLEETNYTVENTQKKRMDEQFRYMIQEAQKTCKQDSNKGIIITKSNSA